MKSFKKLQSLFILCFIAAGLAAPLHAQEAKVLKVSGAAHVQLPGSSTSVAITADMMIPEGALISTQGDGQVYLETHPGQVATIEANTNVLVEKLAVTKQGQTVTSQEALLDLKRGSIISTLDPSKKDINRYGVRTPKGVAAARGTVYGVTVNLTGGSTVATMTGLVTINLGNGQVVNIPVGQALVPGADSPVAIQAAIVASGQTGLTLETLLREAVEAVAANVAINSSALGGDSAAATTALAAVVSAAATANPSAAASYAATAVAAAVSASSTTGRAGDTVSNAAVAAITEAATRASPNSVAQISQSVANAVVQTKVADAVAAATLAGQDVTAAAQTAANAATQTLQSIAQGALAGAGPGVNAAAVVTAINTGSQTAINQLPQQVASTPAPAITIPETPAGDTPPASTPIIVTPETPTTLPPVSPSGSGF